MPETRELLREGKGKKIYTTDDPDYAVVYFKDEATAFHGLKRGRILGKGEVNNAVCGHLFQLLAREGVENHFVSRIDARQSLIKRCEMIPIAVTVRNRVAGSLSQRLGLQTGKPLDEPVVEFTLKNEFLDNPLINFTHVRALKLATAEETNRMFDVALKVNKILTDYMSEISVELINLKLEFGRYHGKVLLADEISSDTCRFWDARTHEPLDIDRFRQDMGNVEQAYQELLHRMMGVDEESEK